MTQKSAARSEQQVATEVAEVKQEAVIADSAVVNAVATVDAPVTITRAEIEEMVASAVKAAIAAQEVAVVPEVAEVAVAAVAVVAAPQETAVEQVLRSVAASVAAVADSVNAVGERLKTLEGKTTVRADDGDGKQGKTSDAFKGLLGKVLG